MPFQRKPTDEPERPKKLSVYTLKLAPEAAAQLRAALERRLWPSREVAHAAFAYSGPDVQVVCYASGKLVVQGRGTEDFVQNILESEVTHTPLLGYDEVHHPDYFELHAGCDEAGKGDIFGPLVTACVVLEPEAIRALLAAGVRDSKKISDNEVLRLEKIIRLTEGAAVAVGQCSMEKYNELMSKPGANLNRLLAWLHAKSLQNALEKHPAPWGLLDQFARRDAVGQYLARPGFELRRRTKAESDPVVACASIVARAEFLRGLKKLREEAGVPLMKGASRDAQAQFAALREKIGPTEMARFAKLHFKLKSLRGKGY